MRAERGAIEIEPAGLGVSRLYFDGSADLLYHRKTRQCAAIVEPAAEGDFKDAFHDRIVHGR